MLAKRLSDVLCKTWLPTITNLRHGARDRGGPDIVIGPLWRIYTVGGSGSECIVYPI